MKLIFRYIVLLTVFALVRHSAYAQKVVVAIPDKDVAIENVIKYLSENDEDNIDFDELSSNLSYLYDHPINLNSCTEEELYNIQLFSSILVMNILDYRKKYKSFITLYELKLIEGFTQDLIMLAIPFLSTPEKEPYKLKINFKNLVKRSKQFVIVRYQRVLEEQSGYIPNVDGETKYLGSPDRLYTRYQLDFSNQLKAGFTCDKDAGEPFFEDPNKQGFDFMSGFVQLKNQGLIKSLVVGDYVLQFGQGLVLWNGFGMRKSAMVSNVTKFGKGVDKYSSIDENNFFRGVATTLQYKHAELSVFYSNKKIDGRVNRDTLSNEIDEFTSIDRTGLHATASAFEKKHTVSEQLYGVNYTHRFNRLKVGATWISHQYSVPLLVAQDLYRKHDFSGKENYNVSLFYQWQLNHIFLAGEVATDPYQNIAVTNHAVINLSTKLGLVLLHRYFNPKYQSMFSSAFAEGSEVQNETGFYIGVQFYPTRNWNIKAYVDYYRFPWLKNQISRPSSGVDYLVVGEYNLSRNFNMCFRYKNESHLKDLLESDVQMKSQKTVRKQQLRFHFDYGDRNTLRFKTRVEWSWYEHQSREKGFLAYQDVICQWQKIPLHSTLRFLVFDTDGYKSRIYTFENELLYNFYLPAFSERGIRTYLLLKYQIIKNLDVWLKYGLTVYSDKKTIDSSYNEIQGDSKSDIKFQVRFKF